MSSYVPGVCNIGKDEIRKRYTLAVIGFIVSAFLVFLLLFFSAPRWTLLFVFFPLALAFEGLFQGSMGFCAGFASRGIYDLSGSGGEKGTVQSEEEHGKDMKKAMMIHAYSILSSIILAAVIYLVAAYHNFL